SQPMLAGVLKYFVDGLTDPDAAIIRDLPLFDGMDLLYAAPLMIDVISAWRGVGSYLGQYYLSRVSLGLIDSLLRALFDSLLRLPNRYFDENISGHLISRISYNVTMVTGAATDAIKIVVREGLTVIFLFAYLLWMNW